MEGDSPIEAIIKDRELTQGEVIRVLSFVLRHHASDAEIRDTLVDEALPFYREFARDLELWDPHGADRRAVMADAIERATLGERDGLS